METGGERIETKAMKFENFTMENDYHSHPPESETIDEVKIEYVKNELVDGDDFLDDPLGSTSNDDQMNAYTLTVGSSKEKERLLLNNEAEAISVKDEIEIVEIKTELRVESDESEGESEGKEMEQLIDSIESLRKDVQACRQRSDLNTVQRAKLSSCVVGMRLELKNISKHITDACNGNHNKYNQPPSFFLSAIKSKEELDVMECSLSNKDKMGSMIEWINRTQKLRKKENRLNSLFYMLLDRSFLLNCSWLGQKYKGVSKIPFGNYTNLISLLQNASGMNGTEVEKFIKCKLMNSAKAARYRGLYKSVTHNRNRQE